MVSYAWYVVQVLHISNYGVVVVVSGWLWFYSTVQWSNPRRDMVEVQEHRQVQK